MHWPIFNLPVCIPHPCRLALPQVLISKKEAVAGRVVGHVRGLEAEVDVLKHLDHPNIVRYLARHGTPLPMREKRPKRLT